MWFKLIFWGVEYFVSGWVLFLAGQIWVYQIFKGGKERKKKRKSRIFFHMKQILYLNMKEHIHPFFFIKDNIRHAFVGDWEKERERKVAIMASHCPTFYFK